MKFLLCLVLLFVPITVFADTMCVRDNTLVVSLDYTVLGTSSGMDANNSTFWGDFPYGRLYGEGTCLSAAEGLGQITGGYGNYYGIDEYEKTLITAEKGMSGTDADGNERIYCWCRLTHPASSAWVLHRNFGTADACKKTCVTTGYYSCSGRIVGKDGGDMLRLGMFKSIGLQ